MTKTKKKAAKRIKDAKQALASPTIPDLLRRAKERHPEHGAEYDAALRRDAAFRAELVAEVAMDRDNPAHFQAWCDRSDDVLGHPFVVVYADRAVWPASDYFRTEAEARAAMGRRLWQNLQERRIGPKRQEQGRIIEGTHPPLRG